MKFIVEIEVNSCEECKHHSFNGYATLNDVLFPIYRCNHKGLKTLDDSYGRFINLKPPREKIDFIPEWCPLIGQDKY